MKALIALAAALAVPAAAQAGEVACWYEQGVLVVPASVAGLAGDYILDTGSPVTLLHETKGQMAGYETPEQRGEVRVAGVTLPDRPFIVKDLDRRTARFPTPIAGVIGADVLAAFVVDVRFTPCRLSVRRPLEAPAFRVDAALPLRADRVQAAGRAVVSDGVRAFGADFAIATGSDAGIRLDNRLARAPSDVAEPNRLLPNGGTMGRLAAVSIAGQLAVRPSAGLEQGEDADLAGSIGGPLLAAWRLRFDFPRKQLLLSR